MDRVAGQGLDAGGGGGYKSFHIELYHVGSLLDIYTVKPLCKSQHLRISLTCSEAASPPAGLAFPSCLQADVTVEICTAREVVVGLPLNASEMMCVVM